MRFKRVYIEITNVCNLNCEFCKKHHRKNEFMTKENFEYILGEIAPYTKYIYLHVKGEPLLHPDFDFLVKKAHEMGFLINLTTNGTMLHQHLNITKYLRQINVSFHATNDAKLIETCRQIQDCIVNYRVWNKEENQEAIELIKSAYSIQRELKEPNDKLASNAFVSIASKFEWPDIEKEEESNGYCYALKDQIAILVDGTVVPCCLDDEGNINLGNVFTTSLDSILNGERAKRILEGFQKRIAVEELCKRCSYKMRF